MMLHTPLEDKIKDTEIKLTCIFAADHLPFNLIDQITKICTNIFSDSDIAKNVRIKRPML